MQTVRMWLLKGSFGVFVCASYSEDTVLLLLLSGWADFCIPAYPKEWLLWNTGLKMNGPSGCSVAAVVDVSWLTRELLKQLLNLSVEPAVLRQRGWFHPCSCLVFKWMLHLSWSSLWAFTGSVRLCAVMALLPELSQVVILQLIKFSTTCSYLSGYKLVCGLTNYFLYSKQGCKLLELFSEPKWKGKLNRFDES